MGKKHHLWSRQDNLLQGQPARMGFVVIVTSPVRYFLQVLEAVHYPSLPCCSCRCARMSALSYHQHGLITLTFRAAKINAKKYILILGWADIGHAPLNISGFLYLLLCAFYSCSLSFLTMFFLTVFCPFALVKAAGRMKLEQVDAVACRAGGAVKLPSCPSPQWLVCCGQGPQASWLVWSSCAVTPTKEYH